MPTIQTIVVGVGLVGLAQALRLLPLIFAATFFPPLGETKEEPRQSLPGSQGSSHRDAAAKVLPLHYPSRMSGSGQTRILGGGVFANARSVGCAFAPRQPGLDWRISNWGGSVRT
jgi:hypothetical protein